MNSITDDGNYDDEKKVEINQNLNIHQHSETGDIYIDTKKKKWLIPPY